MKGFLFYQNMEINLAYKHIPSRKVIAALADQLYSFLFELENSFPVELYEESSLARTVTSLLNTVCEDGEKLTNEFFEELIATRKDLLSDAQFFVESDPAAVSFTEVIVAYPGFYAITIHRIAHLLYRENIPIIPRLFSEHAHSTTGIDIHPGATIATPFFIDHGTGVVIGQTTQVGKNVRMYQGVTLGALAVVKEGSGKKRHPTIEDNVIIYAGSCILGGETTVGHDTIIGGNVWLTHSVAPFSLVYHNSEVKIRDKSEMKEVIDFII